MTRPSNLTPPPTWSRPAHEWARMSWLARDRYTHRVNAAKAHATSQALVPAGSTKGRHSMVLITPEIHDTIRQLTRTIGTCRTADRIGINHQTVQRIMNAGPNVGQTVSLEVATKILAAREKP